METRAAIRGLLREELDRPPGAEALALTQALAARPGALAALFYGARRRAPEEAGGPLDLYVLTERDALWHGPGLRGRVAALANRLLPPNVYRERAGTAEAKVAVMRLAAFRARMRPGSWDTTLWARFSQPATLVWARDAAAREAVEAALVDAVETAGLWAARLAPAGAEPLEAWAALFRATYRAELRVEREGRASALVAAAPERWRRLHALVVAPRLNEARSASLAWASRSAAGKAVNLTRLLKAAATYSGGPAYLLDKIARHSPAAARLRARLRRS